MSRARETGRLAVYGAPLAIGALASAGLLAALLFDDIGRWFSWIALGVPVAIAAWRLVRLD